MKINAGAPTRLQECDQKIFAHAAPDRARTRRGNRSRPGPARLAAAFASVFLALGPCSTYLLAQPDGPRLAAPGAADETGDAKAIIDRIVRESDDGHDVGLLVNLAGDLGAAALRESAARFDPQKPARNAALAEVMAQAGRTRRSHRELLHLYDPEAEHYFYSDQANALQQPARAALDLSAWPLRLPEAAVRGAPLPALDWLAAQARDPGPRLPELQRLLQAWGFWVRVGHERQCHAALADAAAALAGNAAITRDENALAALCRFSGEVRAASTQNLLLRTLQSGPAKARVEAAAACGRLATPETKAALLAAAARETDAPVQEKIAAVLDPWRDDQAVGAALATLYDKAASPAVRREVLFTCAAARWPQRLPLLQRAFADATDADGLLGVALLALAQRPEPALQSAVLELAAATKDAQPPLIDALGASGDRHAVPHLLRWLGEQPNPVVRVKLMLALEKTAQHEADAALMHLITTDTNAMVVEQAIGVAARKQVAACAPAAAALALDATAPGQVRIESIWALGFFDTRESRQTLTRIDAEADTLFAAAGTDRPVGGEAADMARMMAALARLRLGEPDAADKLQRAFDRGTATARLTALIMLTKTGRDHPIIAQGLASTDLAVLLGAVRAASAIAPERYHDTLAALENKPFLNALLDSGLDSAGLRDALADALGRHDQHGGHRH